MLARAGFSSEWSPSDGHSQDSFWEGKEIRPSITSPLVCSPPDDTGHAGDSQKLIAESCDCGEFLGTAEKGAGLHWGAALSEGNARVEHFPVLGGTLAEIWDGFSPRNEKNCRHSEMGVTLSTCIRDEYVHVTEWGWCQGGSDIQTCVGARCKNRTVPAC